MFESLISRFPFEYLASWFKMKLNTCEDCNGHIKSPGQIIDVSGIWIIFVQKLGHQVKSLKRTGTWIFCGQKVVTRSNYCNNRDMDYLWSVT